MKHFVTGKNLFDEYPAGSCQIIFGAGCFWGVERVFWQLDGVWTTYVSYSGGRRENPSYEQVCTGVTVMPKRSMLFINQMRFHWKVC